MEITSGSVGPADDSLPDYVGAVATCPTCGSSLGPLSSNVMKVSATMRCGCSKSLTVWAT